MHHAVKKGEGTLAFVSAILIWLFFLFHVPRARLYCYLALLRAFFAVTDLLHFPSAFSCRTYGFHGSWKTRRVPNYWHAYTLACCVRPALNWLLLRFCYIEQILSTPFHFVLSILASWLPVQDCCELHKLLLCKKVRTPLVSFNVNSTSGSRASCLVPLLLIFIRSFCFCFAMVPFRQRFELPLYDSPIFRRY